MLFISAIESNDRIMITNTYTEQTTPCTYNQVLNLVAQGTEVKGVDGDKVLVYASVEEFRKRVALRVRLSSKLVPRYCELSLEGKARLVELDWSKPWVSLKNDKRYLPITEIGSIRYPLDLERRLDLSDTPIERLFLEAFWGSIGLEEIILPDTLRVIDEGVFESCFDLRRVKIPEGVKQIPKRCFTDCPRLTYLGLPHSIEYIDDNFYSIGNSFYHDKGDIRFYVYKGSYAGDYLMSKMPSHVVWLDNYVTK